MALVALLVAVRGPPPQVGVDLDPGSAHGVSRRSRLSLAVSGKQGNVVNEASSDLLAERSVLAGVQNERVPSVIDQFGWHQASLRVKRAGHKEAQRLPDNPPGSIAVKSGVGMHPVHQLASKATVDENVWSRTGGHRHDDLPFHRFAAIVIVFLQAPAHSGP